MIFLYLYGQESVNRLASARLGVERLLLAPLPFKLKQRAIHLLRPAPTCTTPSTCSRRRSTTGTPIAEVRAWLVESGFTDVVRTIDHTELFLRGARRPEAIAPFTVPPPRRRTGSRGTRRPPSASS